MARVRFDDATRVYPGSDHASVDSLTLDIAEGEFVVLLGPPGCGKSTALRMLAGLEEVTSGRIFIDEVDVTSDPPKERDVAMVFQNYALYPHMTIADNMGFALRIAGIPVDEIEARVRNAARILQLEDRLRDRPQDLTGGQRQRVAMGRAIVREPRVFLMDEPIDNLEPELRNQTRDQIAALQRELGITTVYATANPDDAVQVGHRIAVLDQGHLHQFDTPDALRERPASLFVAYLLGGAKLDTFIAPVTDGVARLGNAEIELTPAVASAVGDTVVVTAEADNITATAAPGGLNARVESVTVDAGQAYVHVIPRQPVTHSTAVENALVALGESDAAERAQQPRLVATLPDDFRPETGTDVFLVPAEGSLSVFHPETGVRIGP